MSCSGCDLSFRDFLRFSDSELLDYLRRHNVVLSEKVCPKCGAMCKTCDRRGSLGAFRCRAYIAVKHSEKKKQKVQCNYEQSIKANTFFAGCTFSITELCEFVALDVMRVRGETEFLESEMEWGRQSVVNWKSFLREVYLDWSISYSSPIIGGNGKIIEIDAIKVGKRKYNRGRIAEGQTVFAGIERESGDFFISPAEKSDAHTLLQIIKDRVLDGTTIMSECWKTFDCLEEEGFRQQAVNHSKKFINPSTQPLSQNIEKLWRDMRGNIPRFGQKQDHYLGYLAKFQFHRRFPNHRQRIHELFMAIGRLYNPSIEASVNNNVVFSESIDAEEY